MTCDDCGIETGGPGNHGTDAECMEALKGELTMVTGLLRQARDEIQNCIIPEVRNAELYDKINNALRELAGGDREETA